MSLTIAGRLFTGPFDLDNTVVRPNHHPAVFAIVAKHGEQFSDEQKVDLKKQLLDIEEAGAALAGFELEENSEPAFLFRVYRKEGR